MASTNDAKRSLPPWYCITQDRCRLCQFKLEPDESIVAAVGDDRVSCEFFFRRHTVFFDHELDIKLHMCLAPKCLFRTKTTVCFHNRCYESRLYSVTPTFLAATNYAFAPSASEERRRAQYIQQALSRNLQLAEGWHGKLLPELWFMIAGLLVEASAAITAQEQVHGCDDTSDSVLDLTQSIYVSYVKIDGRHYVKSLQNTAEVNAKKGTYLLMPAPTTRQAEREDEGEEGKDMLVVEDHLGIRQIFFVSPMRCDEWCCNHPSVPGAWWKLVSHKALPPAVVIRSDGLKMRDVRSLQKGPILPGIGWPAPISSPPPALNLSTLEIPREYLGGLRMRFFECNAPYISGYSIATDGIRILSFLSHKQDQKLDAGLFGDIDSPNCFWMYMPISQGEYLTDICRRAWSLTAPTESIGIMVSTNKGRIVVFGLDARENVNLHRVATLPDSPCRVYFNYLDSLAGRRKVELIAIETDGAAPSLEKLPKLPVPISNCPSTGSAEAWLHSSCTMAHVTEVQLASIGLLRISKCWGCVAVVTVRAPMDRKEDRWLGVAQYGTLEWWFSSNHIVLCYDGIRLN